MTTPTREQVIQWAKEAGFGAYGLGLIEDGAAPEVANLCAIAMDHARAQALDEAAQLCDDWANSEPEMSAPQLALDLAADAIRQLKGKQ